jgi:NAD(P)-dependent dehydrogenase (short-subunit alcohol dehydrogenase family)
MDMTSKRLEGRTALVTGGGGGVGRGIALELARAGCRVAVNDVAVDPAEETVEQVKSIGGDAFAVRGSVADAAEVKATFATVLARLPRLDILVNNAGVQTWKPFLEVTEAEWDFVIDTNLKGCFLNSQAAALHMKDHGGGAIVNIGSGCSKIAFPNLVAYTASKGGIDMLTKVAAVELGRYGIRVNCVGPGAIEIERTRREGGDFARIWSELTPLGRVGTPSDVGQAVVYLASDDASFVSGQTLWVDGGVFSQARWPDRAYAATTER